MKKLLIGAIVASALAFPAAAALKPGEKAPSFKAPASLAGKTKDFDLDAALKKGPVVVYFYPAAYTGGCSAEAHAFAEDADKFAEAKATIIGVSADPIDRLNEFSADPAYCAGKFPVASDPTGTIGKSFGLTVRSPNPGDAPRAPIKDVRGKDLVINTTIERTTFVITPDHKIVATLSSADDKIKPTEHADKSLAMVQSLVAKKN